MSIPSIKPISASGPRERPTAHFTPSRGWINDPYGVRQVGSEYVVHYQCLPDRIMSIMQNHQAKHVAAPVGEFDGQRFRHHGWRRLSYGDLVYATTVLYDAESRPCALSWLREDHDRAEPTYPWVGAHSPVSYGDSALSGEDWIARWA